MKFFIILSIWIIACAAEYYKLPKDHLTSDELKNNPGELKARADCFLNQKPCTPLYAAYKDVAQDLVNNSCVSCAAEMKELTQAFLIGLKKYYPEEYRDLILKYDPTVVKFNALEKAVGVLETLLSSLPALPSIPSLPSIESLPLLPTKQSIPSLPSIESLSLLPTNQSIPSLPSIESLPLLPTKQSIPSLPSIEKLPLFPSFQFKP